MYLPKGEHTNKAVCIVIHRKHGMHTVPVTLLHDTKALLLRTAIRGTPIRLGSVQFLSGDNLETAHAYLVLADSLQEAIRDRSNEEEDCIGMDANVEVASRHRVAGRAGVIGGQTNRSTLRAANVASPPMPSQHPCERGLHDTAIW